MTDQAQDRSASRPIVRDYMIVCLCALGLMTLVLLRDGINGWALLPLLVGTGCVLARWSIGVPVVLGLMGFYLASQSWLLGYPWWYRPDAEPLLDLLLAACTVVFTAAHGRLMSLERSAAPGDIRRARRPPGTRAAGRWLLPRETTRRVSARLASNEIGWMVVMAPVCAVTASLLWFRLADERPPESMGFPPHLWPLWHAFAMLWVIALFLLLGRGFLGWLGRAEASPEESLLYLQDQLWAETRGEQRRINRWIVWGRLRRQRKEEG